MDHKSLVDLWHARAEEARALSAQMKDGSVSQELLLSMAASYLRLAERGSRDFPCRSRR
jgi:hypothetical protein